MTFDCTAGMAPRQGSVQVGNISLAYHEWAGGERPCVILHGITSSAGTLWRVGPALAAQGYHVYAFDLPGHGASSETDDHRIGAQAALIRAVLGELGLSDDVTLLGHSWGGAIALTLAATDSAGLASVVLIDPALHMDAERGERSLPTYLAGLGEPPEATLPGLIANNPDWHRCDAEHKAEALRDCGHRRRPPRSVGPVLHPGQRGRRLLPGRRRGDDPAHRSGGEGPLVGVPPGRVAARPHPGARVPTERARLS